MSELTTQQRPQRLKLKVPGGVPMKSLKKRTSGADLAAFGPFGEADLANEAGSGPRRRLPLNVGLWQRDIPARPEGQGERGDPKAFRRIKLNQSGQPLPDSTSFKDSQQHPSNSFPSLPFRIISQITAS